MKRFPLLLLSTCFLAACTVSNRITVMDTKDDGLTSIRLVQSPEAKSAEANSGLPAAFDKSLFTVYQYEEKTAARPEITLDIQPAPGIDSVVFINLDNEAVGLNSKPYADQKLSRRYVIPENLWVSIVHSKDIFYRINRSKEAIHIVLNASEKDKLVKFLKMSIDHRDAQFPAIPEGQVKW